MTPAARSWKLVGAFDYCWILWRMGRFREPEGSLFSQILQLLKPDTMDRMQNSAPSWITGVRHLESSFASFATTRSRSTCTCTSIQIQAKFVAWSCESFDVSLFVSLSLCLDSQARCSAGGSVGHFWSDRYELWGCVSAEAEKEGAA